MSDIDKDAIRKLMGKLKDMEEVLSSLLVDNVQLDDITNNKDLDEQLLYIHIDEPGMIVPYHLSHVEGRGQHHYVVGEPLPGVKREYNIQELCVKKFPNVKLSNVLNKQGWFLSNKSCNGIMCIPCDDRPTFWTVDDNVYVPNVPGRHKYLVDELRAMISHERYVNSDDINELLNSIAVNYIPRAIIQGEEFNE